MKVTKIIYSKKFPYAPYLNESIGFEADVLEGENVYDSIQILRELAENSFKTAHPTVIPQTPVEQTRSKEEMVADTIQAITSTLTMKELEEYKLLKGVSKDIFNAYNVREKELIKYSPVSK